MHWECLSNLDNIPLGGADATGDGRHVFLQESIRLIALLENSSDGLIQVILIKLDQGTYRYEKVGIKHITVTKEN